MSDRRFLLGEIACGPGTVSSASGQACVAIADAQGPSYTTQRIELAAPQLPARLPEIPRSWFGLAALLVLYKLLR